jgi:hypothetical protein
MVKLIFMLRYSIMFLFLLLASCGTRKVAIVKEDTKITIDSTAIVKTDSVSTINNNIKIVENTDELEICPLSDTIPMFVNGIMYKNAKLTYRKTKKMSIDTTVKKVSKKESIKSNVKKLNSTKVFKKEIDRKQGYSIYIGIFLIIILLFLIFYLKEKLLKFLP